MVKGIVQPALAIPSNEVITAAMEFALSMGAFFDLADREISKANSTEFDGLEFLLKGARTEIRRLDAAIFKAQERAAA